MEARCGILNCTRQWGKSTVSAAKAVHQAWHKKGSLTIVVNPTARQSSEFVRKAAEFVRRLDIKPKGDGDNEIRKSRQAHSVAWYSRPLRMAISYRLTVPRLDLGPA